MENKEYENNEELSECCLAEITEEGFCSDCKEGIC